VSIRTAEKKATIKTKKQLLSRSSQNIYSFKVEKEPHRHPRDIKIR